MKSTIMESNRQVCWNGALVFLLLGNCIIGNAVGLGCIDGCIDCIGSVKCKTCDSNYYLANEQCLPCPQYCATCTSSPFCDTCRYGLYGATCQHDCSLCQGELCSNTTCSTGCKTGFYTAAYGRCANCRTMCISCTDENTCNACISGKWGTACQNNCLSPYCKDNTCDIHNSECDSGCIDGYYSAANYCYTCPEGCVTCSSIASCGECIEGRWGLTCQNRCQNDCQICPRSNGSCGHECIPGKWGISCQSDCYNGCSQCYGSGIYDCLACKDGYTLLGSACQVQCSASCEQCLTPGVCDRCFPNYYILENACIPCPVDCASCSSSSVCTSCSTGYALSGNACIQCPVECGSCSSPNVCTSCITGYINSGYACIRCPVVCSACSSSNVCTSCTTGYRLSGNMCIQCPVECNICVSPNVCTSCHTGYVLSGNTCSVCPVGCATCSSPNVCTSCITGSTCSILCPVGCSTCSSPNVCTSCITDYVLSGNTCIHCPVGCDICLSSSQCINCSSGYYASGNSCIANAGNKSSQSNKHAKDATNIVVIGVAAGGGAFLLIIAGVIVVCLILRRRRRSPLKNTDEEITTANIDTANSTNINDADTGYIYAMPNKVKQNTDIQLTTLPIRHSNHEAPPLSRHSVLEEVDGDLEDLDDDEGEVARPVKAPLSGDNVYYTNVAGLKRSRVQIDKLQDYVDMKTKENFLNEFQKLPQGLSRPCNDALKPVNRSKNRYKSVYPYDVSRVKLTGGGSDFINANYIDGYNEPNAYIASQGPTDGQMKDFVDFWRMVWQERVEKIVMLTNLFEDGKMKCEEYWPDTGGSHTYGDVTVTCLCEDRHAEHTVKDFTVSKDSEKRSLHHIHFTAWPDKGVPDDVTSLIEFRQKVLKTRSGLGGPIIVHCSAGVGRTGTYIALDVLTKEGNAEKSVDIFGCVTGMRSQRVAMIQTEDQYEYLHNSVVHALTFDCQPIPVDMFQQYMSNNTLKLDVQFEHIGSSAEKKTTDEIEAIQRNKKLHDKNRKHADVPGNLYRPRLHLQRKPESSDYVNAIYLNSYTTKKRYIVAQTPLRGTLADFLCLVVQEQCSCIVSMDDETLIDNTVGRYLPAANQDLKHGRFKIHCVSCESKLHHTVRILTITHQGLRGPDEKTVYHFQFTDWKKNIPIPSDPSSFLNLIMDVDKMFAESENKGPMLIHCLNGAERSGLFCAVSVLIQKMEIEHEVSVVNTVRQIRSRRGSVIPNKEQYSFSHECVCAYLQSFGVYANEVDI